MNRSWNHKITNSLISGNSAGESNGGGILSVGYANLIVENSTISKNYAENGCAGVLVEWH